MKKKGILNKSRHEALRVAKVPIKIIDKGLTAIWWAAILTGLYGATLCRALRSNEIEEDQQENRDE